MSSWNSSRCVVSERPPAPLLRAQHPLRFVKASELSHALPCLELKSIPLEQLPSFQAGNTVYPLLCLPGKHTDCVLMQISQCSVHICAGVDTCVLNVDVYNCWLSALGMKHTLCTHVCLHCHHLQFEKDYFFFFFKNYLVKRCLCCHFWFKASLLLIYLKTGMYFSC